MRNRDEWLGDWVSFESYIDSDDPMIVGTWEEARHACAANPKMAMMAQGDPRDFWRAVCRTTGPNNDVPIAAWHVEPASGVADGVSITWKGIDGTVLGTYDYGLDRVIPHGLEGAPTNVFAASDAPAGSPFSWLIAIDPVPAHESRVGGGLISHVHFQYDASLDRLVDDRDALRNPRWYPTMCADEGDVADRCDVIRALHRLPTSR